jgi:uncharacterized alpha/beta hydrolase family protein
MAIVVHVVRVGMVTIDSLGNSVDKNNTTNKVMMTANSEHRVLVDGDIVSTASNPTVKAYLEAEAALDFVLEHMDQSTIITYLRDDAGGFPSS